MCLLGQYKVFDEASEILKSLLGVDMSSPQIQRVSEYYGRIADGAISRNIEDCIPKLDDVNKDDHVYVMVDGSMLNTIEDKWKEIKLGRIFNERKVIPLSEKRSEIVESVYVSHLGSVNDFFPKLERHLTPYNKKVILGDGAKWIWNWADDNYPLAIQILDFYHAKEKLVIFANHQFLDKDQRKNWVEKQAEKLLDNGVEQVIDVLRKLRPRSEEGKKSKENAINYYLEHEDRMMYKTYRNRGLIIGSGPIEAANKSVIQRRLKLSGQKWSIDGANAIANLRCLKESNAWHIVEKFVKAAA
jgi:hypothetical protein